MGLSNYIANQPLVDTEKHIMEWRDDVKHEMSTINVDQMNKINYHLPNVNLDELAKHTKSTTNYAMPAGNQDFVTINEYYRLQANFEAIQDNEIPAIYYKTVKDYGEVEFWKFNDKHYQIPDKLNPQRFQRQKITKQALQQSNNLNHYSANNRCPRSANNSELDYHNIQRRTSIRGNVMTPEYSRRCKTACNEDKHLCHLCAFKRWIPNSKLKKHMEVAHGVIEINELGYVAYPLPLELFKLSPGRLKCYYCKCPKCGNWVRLGKLVEVGRLSMYQQVQEMYNEEEEDVEVEGLFSNYFRHYGRCGEQAV